MNTNRPIKRSICILLSLSMMIGLLPSYAFAAPEEEPTALGGEVFTAPEGTEGTFLAFAANGKEDDTPLSNWILEERGRYAITVFRAGDLSGETTVDLRTLDISAAYGEDYRIDDPRYETEVRDTNGTYVRQYGGEEGKAEAEAILAELDEAAENAGTEGGDALSDAAPADGQTAPADAQPDSAPADGQSDSAPAGTGPAPAGERTAGTPATSETGAARASGGEEKSELAKLKEAQTGQPTRETYDTELLPMDQSLISYLIPDVGSAMETSSSTTLTFAPGESEKTVIFRILEDRQSEGNEEFILTLSDAEGGAVFMPSMATVMITDDEPVEHSLVTFSAAEYDAESGTAQVKVTRTGAEYALVTAKIRSVETGSAEEGTNFSRVENTIAFDPYVTEATLNIPVRAGEKDLSFGLELSDLRGGEDGKYMSAAVAIPAGSRGDPAAPVSAEDGAPGVLMADRTSLKIPDYGTENFSLVPAGNDSYKIMDESKKPAQQVGVFFLPTDRYGRKNNFGDSGSTSNSWDAGAGRRWLRWYSNYWGDEGGTEFIFKLTKTQLYQQLYVDYSTGSSYNASKCGFWFTVYGPNRSELLTQKYEIGDKNGQKCRGGKLLYADFLDKQNNKEIGKVSGKLVPPAWQTNPENNYTEVYTYTKDTSSGLNLKPTMNIYGYAAMYRQYRVNLEQPAKMKYIDIAADGSPAVVEKAPANVFLGKGHEVRYPYQQISVTDAATDPGEPIRGTLTGYRIKPAGTDGNGLFYATGGSIIDLNDKLMQDLDEYARNNWNKRDSIIQKGAGNVYYMDLTVTPVYEKNYVTVKVTKNPEGAFTWGCLDPNNDAEIDRIARADGRNDTRTVTESYRELVKDETGQLVFVTKTRTVTKGVNNVKVDKQNGTISGLFAVGDRLNLDAVPAEEGFTYTACHYEGFKNPGDTVAEVNMELNQHSQNTGWKTFTVTKSRTELRPEFTSDGNCIQIKYVNGADRYFHLSDLATDGEKNGKFPDRQVLRIDDSLTGDNVTPVLGHAYTLQVVESDSNPGNVRPVFTLADGTKVNGWAVDVIARYKASQNVITVDWERYEPGNVQYFALEGLVLYQSVTVRQGSQGLQNEPAREVMVFAGGVPVPFYTSSGRLSYLVSRPSGETDREGRFVINGVQAVSGDRISVLVDNNGVVQAAYPVLTNRRAVESRTFQEQRANQEKNTNDVVSVTKDCVVMDVTSDPEEGADSDPIRMPVLTGYTPYVSDVRFSLDDHTADGRNNTVPIYAGDYVSLECDVSMPQMNGQETPMKGVQFVIIDKDGEQKDVYDLQQKNSSDGKKLNTWFVRVPFTPPDDSPFKTLSDGDRVFVQVLGPDREVVTTFVNQEGNQEKETQKVPSPYALLNTGLSFFTPVEEAVEQVYEMDAGDKLGAAPLVGSLAGKVDSGNATFGKEYEDPSNPDTSNYIWYCGIGIGVSNDGFGRNSQGQWENKSKDKYNELIEGKDTAGEATKSYENMWGEHKAGDPYKTSKALQQSTLDNKVRNREMTSDDATQAMKDWEAGKKQEFMNDAKKDSLTAFAKDRQQVGGEFKFVLVLQWVYNPETNSHIWWHSSFLFEFAGYGSRTFYKVVGPGIPVYLNLEGRITLSYEGAVATGDQLVYAKEFARKHNIAEYGNSGYHWLGMTITGKVSVGVGIYGILSARGMVKFAFNWTVNPDRKWDPWWGVSFALGGGIGFDLFLVSMNIEYMHQPWAVGSFDQEPVRKEETTAAGQPGSLQGDVPLPGMPEAGPPAVTLSAIAPGKETFNAIEGDGALQSVLVPKAEEIIIEGAMQYVRPRVVALDDDDFLFFFVENKAGTPDDSGELRSEANAATLVYALAHVDDQNRIIWNAEVGTNIVDNDGLADTSPAVLRIGSRVYVAWSTGDATGVETAEGAKEALSGTNIKVQAFDVAGSSVTRIGPAVAVTDDGFENTSPILVDEDGSLGVYYLKQDLSKVDSAENLMNFTGNYNTYAKRLYDADLTPLAQTGAGGGTVGAEEELYVALPGDALTGDLDVIDLTGPDGRKYCLAAYTVDGTARDEEGQLTGEDRTLWLQITDLTAGKSYYPLQLDKGSVAGLQLNDVKIKTRTTAQGSNYDTVSDDTFLTWVSDSTCFNTLSFNELFGGLGEDGGMAAILGLSKEEAASPDWAKTALSRARVNREIAEDTVLRALADGDPVYEQKNFGRTALLENGTANTDRSLSKYILVTGADGNTYLGWTESTGGGGNAASELWMSSYYRINPQLQQELDDLDQSWSDYAEAVENGSEDAVPPAELPESIPYDGWTDPVQITDFRTAMTENDRARYDELVARRDATQAEDEELAALNAKYSRGIDELAAVVTHNSGALILANTYTVSVTQTEGEGYSEKDHSLTAIRCIPDTSVEITDLSILDPVRPGDTVRIRWNVANSGLLPATDYYMVGKALVDGTTEVPVLGEWERNGAWDTLYPGMSNAEYFDWTVPAYSESLSLTLAVTEQNPAESGTPDFETTNSVTLDLGSGTDLTLGLPYGRMAMNCANKAVTNAGDDAALYGDGGEVRTDREYDALIRYYGDAAALLKAYGDAVDEGSDESHRYFYVFVPASNYGNKVLTDLTFTVTGGEDGRVMGESKLDFLDMGESRLVPILIPVRKSEFGQLGMFGVDVTVKGVDRVDETGAGEPVDLAESHVNLQLPENADLQIVGAGGDAGKVKVHEDVSLAQMLYQTINGDGAVGTEEWNKLASSDPNSRGKTIDLKVGESIQLDTVAFPFDSLKQVEYWDSSAALHPDDGVSESEAKSVIAVTGDGKVTALKPGVAMVSATDLSTGDGQLSDTVKNLTDAEGGAVGMGVLTDAMSAVLLDQVIVRVTGDEDPHGGGGGGGSGGSGGGSAPATTYAVILPATATHGTVSASATAAKAGDKVTITVTPDPGYRVTGVAVKDAEGNLIPVTDNGDGTYTFTMPATAVNVVPGIAPIEDAADDAANCPRDASCPISKFTDAKPDAWYHDGVHWALVKGIMNGTSDTTFEPNGSATRAMVVTMLWRLAGEPASNDPAPFTDVKAGSWYADAVNWAAETGAVKGTSETTFSPDTPVTREQLAAILYRYAQAQGKGFTGAWMFPLDFSDAGSVSEWADEAMHWMTMHGVINGMGDGTLAPRDNATRAQIATMFMRFAEAMEK